MTVQTASQPVRTRVENEETKPLKLTPKRINVNFTGTVKKELSWKELRQGWQAFKKAR